MPAEPMKRLTIILPAHMAEYLEGMSRYTAETISEIIEDLVFNHFIKNLTIVDQNKEAGVGEKSYMDYIRESEFLKDQLKNWPEGTKEYLMIQSRLNMVEDRINVIGD